MAVTTNLPWLQSLSRLKVDNMLLEKIVDVVFWMVYIYDLLTYPIYWIAQRPWQVCSERSKKRATLKYLDKDRVVLRAKHHERPLAHLNDNTDLSIPEFLERTCKLYKDRKCFGYRKILGKFHGTFEGKPIMKISKNDAIETLTYQEVLCKINNIATGLVNVLELNKGSNILVLGNTRHEWALAAFGSITAGATVATIVPVAPDDDIVYGLKQILPVAVIVEEEFLPKILRVFKNNPDIPFPKIVCMDQDAQKKEDVLLLHEIELKGQGCSKRFPKLNPGDPAVIMYTSGTTAHAKGVVVTHKSVISCGLASFNSIWSLDTDTNYTCLKYLPSAHIFGFTEYFLNFFFGCFTVFGSPYTLTEASPSTVCGEKGDFAVAQPYFIATVPLVLMKLQAGIERKMDSKGPAFKMFFDKCVQYKIEWMNLGYKTPILDKLLFSKIRKALLGGKLKSIICGGAPLPPKVQLFTKAVLCEWVAQGYGTTETSGAITCQYHENINTNEVGFPLTSFDVMLESWDDGGYHTSDLEGPSGELLVSGPCLAECFYKHNDPYDNVAFFRDENGKKWFRTGDIGRVNLGNHALSIIDRKKQLIKLLNGKYVALGNVEAILSQSKLVAMVCVMSRPSKNGLVAIMIPNELESFKQNLEKTSLLESIEMAVVKYWSEEFESVLPRYAVPRAVCLVDGPWTPESGLVTAALKIKRKAIEKHYQSQVDKLFNLIN